MPTLREEASKARERILTAANKPARSIVIPSKISPTLKEHPRWLMWRWFHKDERWTKRPYQIEGLPASATKAAHYATYDDAWQAFLTNEQFDGIGFAMGDGFVGIDLDCCFDGEHADPSAASITRQVGSYTEISPTRTGIKVICRGTKPGGWRDTEEVEIKDKGYFTVTGMVMEGSSDEIKPLRSFEDQPPDGAAPNRDKLDWARNSMRKVPVDPAEKDGSARIVRYARQAVRCGLDDAQALEVIREMLEDRPTPKEWSDDEITARLSDAAKRRQGEFRASKMTLQSLQAQHPQRAEELIDGILRKGELMTFIAASKEGKSWMSYGLAMAVATGMPWLGHETTKGRVLIIDNELQPSELSFRLHAVANKLFIDPVELGDSLLVEPLRGSWPNIGAIDEMLSSNYSDTELNLIIVDAYYRTLPPGMSENDNSAVTEIFNRLDVIAGRHKCSIALVHHASKGDQSGKSITDVGSGAGAMTRAADTHVVLRPHEEDSCAVLEAVCRSHKQPEAATVRFEFPLWTREDSIPPQVRLPKNEADRKQDVRNKEAEDLVLDYLREAVEASLSQIRKGCGLGYDRANKVIAKLKSEDRVQVTREARVRGQVTEIWAILDPIDDAF